MNAKEIYTQFEAIGLSLDESVRTPRMYTLTLLDAVKGVSLVQSFEYPIYAGSAGQSIENALMAISKEYLGSKSLVCVECSECCLDHKLFVDYGSELRQSVQMTGDEFRYQVKPRVWESFPKNVQVLLDLRGDAAESAAHLALLKSAAEKKLAPKLDVAEKMLVAAQKERDRLAALLAEVA